MKTWPSAWPTDRLEQNRLLRLGKFFLFFWRRVDKLPVSGNIMVMFSGVSIYPKIHLK
jgi:hypothetical protein